MLLCKHMQDSYLVATVAGCVIHCHLALWQAVTDSSRCNRICMLRLTAVRVSGHDCEHTARQAGRQYMATAPPEGGPGNAPAHLCCWSCHRLCSEITYRSVHEAYNMHNTLIYALRHVLPAVFVYALICNPTIRLPNHSICYQLHSMF